MSFILSNAPNQNISPLRRMELLLLLSALAALLGWQAPLLQSLRGVPLMPLWLHTVLEMFSVSVALLLFGVTWNAYSRERPGNIVILGCAALAVALLDLGHLLSYKGMPDFITPSGAAKGIDFWLAARAVAAVAALTVEMRAPLPLANSHTRYLLLGGSLGATALIYWLVLFNPQWWPDTFVEGLGLTGLKIGAEWAIIAVLSASALLLYLRTRRRHTRDALGFFGFVLISILSELCFTAYTNVSDVFNLLGHLLKILAYLFLYHAAFVASVREPFLQLRIEMGERLRAEEALRELNLVLEQRVAERTRQLEHANRELEAFSYSVSHDLRGPLRAIDGFSQILSRNYEAVLDAKARDYLGRVCRASQRMGELIDDILHLSHVTRQEMTRSVVDVTQLARAIADDLRQAAPERRVAFAIASGLTVDGDPKLIRIVLENLIGNAWKFSARTPDARIEVGMTHTTGGAAIFVRDNGAGFSMDYAHKLFSAFQRLHSSTEFEGSGIGLATVQRIVHRHGGRAWAESAEGAGATFYFSCEPQQGERAHA